MKTADNGLLYGTLGAAISEKQPHIFGSKAFDFKLLHSIFSPTVFRMDHFLTTDLLGKSPFISRVVVPIVIMNGLYYSLLGYFLVVYNKEIVLVNRVE